MPVYVNEWQNKVRQDSCTDKTLLTVLSVQLSCLPLFCHSFTYTGILSLYCFVSTTVLLYFILPFIYIHRHPFSELFCQYNCLALLYFAIHLHIPAYCLLIVLSVQLYCFTLFSRDRMPVYVNEWQNKVKQDSCTDKTVKRQDAGVCK
jgi:heme oxygenase